MELFPPMPLASWQDTKQTLHRFCQVIGKIRLAASVRRNHWWNVPFHLTGRGITTRPMGQVDGNPIFAIDFDFVDHQLRIHTLDGRAVAVPLQGQSVASFHNQTLQALAELGITVAISHPHPFDLPDAARPFADDTEHATYDPAWAARYWVVLSQVNLVLEEFAARFSGKVSPVHHFWHTLDIAHTRFSDRWVDQPATADPVTREAYSREVISFGFWFGDDRFAEPAFYAYTTPEPAGLAGQPLRPAAAWWDPRDDSHLAVLRYDDARTSDDPRASVLDFYESAYQAGARLAGWDARGLASPGGITDAHLRRHQRPAVGAAMPVIPTPEARSASLPPAPLPPGAPSCGRRGTEATMRQPKRVTVVLDVHPMLRGSEKAVVEAVLGRRPGVERVEANPVAQTATVVFDPARTSLAGLRRWVLECGLHCDGQSVPEHICDPLLEPDPPDAHHQEMAAESAPGHAGHAAPTEQVMRSPHEMMGHGGHGAMSMQAMVADMRNRFLVAALFSIPITLWSPIGREVLGFDVPAPFGLRDDVWMLLLSLPVIFYSCWIFFDGAIRALRARTLDMMVLVAVAVGAGWGYSLVVTLTGGGEVFYEAASVLAAFVLLGHWFEMRARGGANDAIRTLLDLAPPRALVIRDGQTVEIPTAEVQVGDLLLVRPGAKIATDGVVEDGDSEVDESVVTGESLPVHKQPGVQVIGATINKNGTLRVRATKVGADTALAQIVKLVQEAQNSKAPGQRLADRAAFWLVLVALVGGGLTLVAWLAAGRPFSTAILFAITVVVITCPDALGLATPTAIMIGTGLGAQRGVLFKHAVALETAARINTVVLDKTGTLTKGEPEVTEVVPADGVDQAELLRLVAAVERNSEHPLAEAIVRRAEQGRVDSLAVGGFENVPGHGAVGTVQGRRVAVGNRRLMEREQVDLGPLAARREQLASGGRTVVLAAADHRPLGLFAIADAPRETSATAIQALHDAQVQVVMLTGDNRATAERIAAELGIDQVIAEVLPQDKAAKVAELQRGGRRVAMVGDGVNDAPALARADLGVAIGAGTDVAIETADVVLMRSDPLDVPTALRIGRGTLRKERQNLGWAVGYNAVALPIAAGVFEPAFSLVLRPEIAALSMSGSSLIVAVNALTLKRLRLPAAPPPSEPPRPATGTTQPAEATP